MPIEIERKFLVTSDAWRGEVQGAPRRLRQGYLALTDRAVIRVRVAEDSQAWVGIKEHRIGRAHGEYEYPVPVAEATELLALCTGRLIEKRRFLVPVGGHTWEVDEFEGDNAGLVLAEIELDDVGESFMQPEWAGREVTDDRRFYNAALAFQPWTEFAGEVER